MVVSNIKPIIRELQAEFLKRKVVDVSINGNTVIDHNFGSVPEGWYVIDTTSYEPVKRVAWDENTITLTAANPVSVTIMLLKR
jgi:hypothetical protein